MQCVRKNQSADWPQICRPHSDALAACADTAVPHLAAVKRTCAPKIEAYSQCLKAHASATDEQVERACGGVIRELWECSEGVMREYQK